MWDHQRSIAQLFINRIIGLVANLQLNSESMESWLPGAELSNNNNKGKRYDLVPRKSLGWNLSIFLYSGGESS